MLCDKCQALFQGDLPEVDKLGEIHISNQDRCNYGRLNEGCFLCYGLWQQIRQLSPNTTLDSSLPLIITRTLIILATTVWKTLGYFIFDAQAEQQTSEINGVRDLHYVIISGKEYLRWSRPASFSSPDQDFNPEESTGSDMCLNLGKRWLEECVRDHPLCAAPKSNPKLPTRLLQLGQPDSLHARLVQTSDLDFIPSYMTLSHCWGTIPFVKLTAETLETLSLGVLIATLPQTFREAIHVSQHFGAQYLWIDSLCIVQDSAEDWSREASTMGDIYKGSRCNIAASASSSPYSGLFRKRNLALIAPCIVKTNYTGTPKHEWVIHLASSSHDFAESNQPLLNSGWVLQERFLAPRVLHFGTKYIHWECKTLDVSEKYPLLSSLNYNRFKDVESDAHLCWQNLIQIYSRCDLTEERDKLVAISGIAKHIGLEKRECANYSAGLWQSHLLSGLLWESSVQSNHRPVKYRAPTWSWASVTGPITCHKFPQYRLIINDIEIKLEHRTEDIYGEVMGGELRVLCHLKRIQLISLEDSNHKNEVAVFSCGALLPSRPHPTIAMDTGTMSPQSLESLHFLPIGISDCKTPDGDDILLGIILEPTGSQKGQFKRVGFIELLIPFPNNILKIPSAEEKRLMSIEEGLANEDALEYESKKGDMYVISII